MRLTRHISFVLGMIAGCATMPAGSPMHGDELGLKPSASQPLRRDVSGIDQSTDALLTAIEASTGERPVFDGEAFDLHPLTEAPALPSGKEWITERRVLA